MERKARQREKLKKLRHEHMSGKWKNKRKVLFENCMFTEVWCCYSEYL